MTWSHFNPMTLHPWGESVPLTYFWITGRDQWPQRRRGVSRREPTGHRCQQSGEPPASSCVLWAQWKRAGSWMTCTLEGWGLVPELGEVLSNSLTGVSWGRPGAGVAVRREQGCPSERKRNREEKEEGEKGQEEGGREGKRIVGKRGREVRRGERRQKGGRERGKGGERELKRGRQEGRKPEAGKRPGSPVLAFNVGFNYTCGAGKGKHEPPRGSRPSNMFLNPWRKFPICCRWTVFSFLP